MWFCHIRLKDRKVAPDKKPRKGQNVLVRDHTHNLVDKAGQIGGNLIFGFHGGAPINGSNAFRISGRKTAQDKARTTLAFAKNPAVSRSGADITMVMSKRYRETPQEISELRPISFVESQLGEALREDGPILGIEFDPLPPSAFGAPIGILVL